MPANKIIPQTVTGKVAEEITKMIISGEYPGGYQIRQEAVAKEFGVSRVPVREAFRQLEGDGMIEIHTHKGAIVSNLSSADAVDLFETRKVVELFLLKKAVPNASEKDMEIAKRLMMRYEEAVARDADTFELSKLNWEFHTSLIAPSNRVKSVDLIRKFYASLDRYLRLQNKSSTARMKAVRDHKRIYKAYEQGDIEKITILMSEHIEKAYQKVLSALNKLEDV